MKLLSLLGKRATDVLEPDDLLLAAAVAFGHPRPEVAGRVDMVAGPTREELATGADILDTALRPLVTAFAGGQS